MSDEQIQADSLADSFMQLPDPIQELMLSEELAQIADTIASRFQLQQDQKDSLLEEIGLVLLGNTTFDTLRARISTTVSLPPEQTASLVSELHKEIFDPIRHLLSSATSDQPIPKPSPNYPDTSSSLTNHIAQFHERKRQRAEELKKQPGTLPTTVAMSTLPQQSPPNLPQKIQETQAGRDGGV